MTQYDYLFVVLVYRNAGDLEDFIRTLGHVEGSLRLVAVNSYYDDASKAEVEKLCAENGCDFLNVENRGYGSGNNAGIEFARARYRFRYLIVSNPDIVILNLPRELPAGAEGACIRGPVIKTLHGKRQNPCMALYSPFREALMKCYAKHPGSLFPFYLAIAINKLERICFNTLFSRRVKRVYSLHGSFMMFSSQALGLLGTPFDPKMFLFREEDYIARRAKTLGISMIYDPRIRVLHKEDGSVKYADVSVRTHTVNSLREYFGLRQNRKEAKDWKQQS